MNFIDIFKRSWAACTFALLLVITFLSLWPLPELPDLPGTDKTHHLIAYGVLMLPTAVRKPKHWILYGFVFIAYSGVIELVQPFVNRYGEWLDLLANTLGILLGAVTGMAIRFFTVNKLP